VNVWHMINQIEKYDNHIGGEEVTF
jgi:hypothetical protein